MSSNNKTIAKNTIFLYFRMLFTMIVALFTSRVILRILGVEDFGIYQTVAGFVTLISFVSGALATGSSRFITFEMGVGDKNKLKDTFSTVFWVHIFLTVIIVVIAETVGLWFVENKLVIEAARLDSAIFAYHLSILSSIFTLTQVPYNACIIAHEKMSVYAYMSILEVSLKLGIVYCLQIGGFDKLKLYAVLLCTVQIGIMIFYRVYCTRHFDETKLSFTFDRNIVKNVLSYSGWNLFANTALTLNNHGATVLVNMFFNPSVVAARAIASQVNLAANQFINNFRTAANPQIVKRFAAGDFEGSKKLLLTSTKFSFYMMLFLCLPIVLVAESILKLWLGIVPEYAVPFLQISIITSLFQVFDSSFYTALYAKGKIKENSMISPTICFLAFPMTYLLFRRGCSPIASAYSLLVVFAILGLIVKPFLIIKIAGYSRKDIISVFIPCFKVLLSSCAIPLLLYKNIDIYVTSGIVRDLILVAICMTSTGLSVYIWGLDSNLKKMILKKLHLIFLRR